MSQYAVKSLTAVKVVVAVVSDSEVIDVTDVALAKVVVTFVTVYVLVVVAVKLVIVNAPVTVVVSSHLYSA
jgi:hypothetical protein